MSSIFFLLGVLALVFLNGFFVAAEFALIRVRRTRIEQMVKDEEPVADVILHELQEINKYLSASQLGITLASIGIGFLGEPAISRLLEPLFGSLSHRAAVAVSVIIAYLVVAVLHIVGGELVPKFMAIARAESIARKVARPLHLFTRLFSPLIKALNFPANLILRILGYRPDELNEQVTSEDLKLLIGESLRGGALDLGEAGMLSGVFHLHEQEARQVMTPFPAVITTPVDASVGEALQSCVESGHTRLVVIENDNPDRIRGIVHANALIKRLMSEGKNAALEPCIYDAPIVPETKPLDDLLTELKRLRSGMAVVVDEYGRTVGLITIEDIIEEVVGEISDETDLVASGVRQLPNGDWFVRGHVALGDLPDYGLNLPVESEAYNSVGGFVFAELGRLPRRGDTLTVNSYLIRVESVRDNRIESVRISVRTPERK